MFPGYSKKSMLLGEDNLSPLCDAELPMIGGARAPRNHSHHADAKKVGLLQLPLLNRP
jgi:hypothetical protein